VPRGGRVIVACTTRLRFQVRCIMVPPLNNTLSSNISELGLILWVLNVLDKALSAWISATFGKMKIKLPGLRIPLCAYNTLCESLSPRR
jgi:hypothetical protein